MNNPLVSIIIPVYNLEKYLPKCLDSVLAQTYKNIEIIPVDDGSTDNSAEVLKEYAKSDSRVKPVFKENGGVSSARNCGIDNSNGEYIYFLDGDDWIAPDTIEKLLTDNTDFDIVQAAHIEAYEDGREILPTQFKSITLLDKKEIIGAYFLNIIQESCCNKLFKKSAIGDTRFDNSLAVAEDSKFTYTILKNAARVKLIDDVTYYYFSREDSCMHQNLTEKHFDPLKLRDMQLSEIGNDKELYKKFIHIDSKFCFYLIREILLDDSKKYVDRLPTLRCRVLKHKFKIFVSEYLGLRFKIGVFLLWLCPPLFYKIYSK